MKRKPITLELGGKLSIKDMKGLLKASYKKNNKDVNNFEIDNDLSTKKVKVFKDKDTNQVVVSHRGTSDLKDVITDVKMLFGNYKNDPRYKESKKVQQLAQDKYGKENITTVGHSLGAKLAEDLGRDTKEIITFNKPTLPIDLIKGKKINENQFDIKTKLDPISLLKPFQKSNRDIVIQSQSINPLQEHKLSSSENVNEDMVVGLGKQWKRQDKLRLISIEPSNRKDKRFVALYLVNGKSKKVHFGLKNPIKGTYIDHKDKEIRKNYIARHSALEKKFLNNPLTPSSLSMYILWGPHTEINKNIKYFKNLFNL